MLDYFKKVDFVVENLLNLDNRMKIMMSIVPKNYVIWFVQRDMY